MVKALDKFYISKNKIDFVALIESWLLVEHEGSHLGSHDLGLSGMLGLD